MKKFVAFLGLMSMPAMVIANHLEIQNNTVLETLSDDTPLPIGKDKSIRSEYQAQLGFFRIYSMPGLDSLALHYDRNHCIFSPFAYVEECKKIGYLPSKLETMGVFRKGDRVLFVLRAINRDDTLSYYRLVYDEKAEEIWLMDADVTEVLDPFFNIVSSVMYAPATFRVQLK